MKGAGDKLVILPSLIKRLRLEARLRHWSMAYENLGLKGLVLYFVQRINLRLNRSNRTIRLISKLARYPLECRANASDFQVFTQIFIDREYVCMDEVVDPKLIIDCGANAGYAASYFLSRFPNAKLIAIEPDNGNFKLMSQNLAPFGDRARLICAAVWSHAARLTLSEKAYRDGREWGRQVREATVDEMSDIPAIDIQTLLNESNEDRISILKVDIEGAEAVLFAENYESWINLVDNIVIELHDDTYFGDCAGIFARAIAGRGFSEDRCGERVICKRVRFHREENSVHAMTTLQS